MESLERLGEKIREEEESLLASSTRRALVRAKLAEQPREPAFRSGVFEAFFALPVFRALFGGGTWWRVPVYGAALAGVAAVVWRYTGLMEGGAMTAEVRTSAETISVGSWVSATHAPVPLDFSDGTTMALGPASRARLANINVDGAHVVLESGSLDVAVVHRKKASWQLSTGPFAVHVIGTKFRVAWDPDRDEFTLVLHEGEVRLSGCMFGAGRTVLAKETVRASCSRRHFEIESAEAEKVARIEEAPSEPAREPTALPSPQPRAPSQLPPAPRLPKETEEPIAPGWRELARRGDYRAAYTRAEAEGFEALVTAANSAELTELGDLARYAGQPAKAERAYHEQRRRFPGSSGASMAAFALGRIAFDQRRSYPEAAQWFQTYLTENRNGSLAREAHGRWFEALARSGNRLAARRVAEQYLKQHPGGPHARLARELVSTDPAR